MPQASQQRAKLKCRTLWRILRRSLEDQWFVRRGIRSDQRDLHVLKRGVDKAFKDNLSNHQPTVWRVVCILRLRPSSVRPKVFSRPSEGPSRSKSEHIRTASCSHASMLPSSHAEEVSRQMLRHW